MSLTKKIVSQLLVFTMIFSFSLFAFANGATAASPSLTITNLLISPKFAADKTMFAATEGAGIFRTTDGGDTWQQLSLGKQFSSKDLQILSLLISPNFAIDNTLILYARLNNVSEKQGFLSSTDCGNSWSFAKSIYSFSSVEISPNYASDRAVYGLFIDGDIWKSTDKGKHWSDLSVKLTLTDIFQLFFSPTFGSDKTIFANAFEGIYKSTNAGVSWKRVLKATTWFPPAYSMAISSTFNVDGIVFANNGKNIIKTSNSGSSWTIKKGIKGDPYDFLISPNYDNDSTVFVATTKANIYKSTNGGQDWAKTYSKFPNNSNVKLTISTNFQNDNTIFASGNPNTEHFEFETMLKGVYKSIDGGVNFVPINNGLSKIITKLTLRSNHKVINKGQSIVLTGKLTKANGEALASRMIRVRAGRKTIKTVKLSKKGFFKVKLFPAKTTSYNVYFDESYACGSTASKQVRVTVR